MNMDSMNDSDDLPDKKQFFIFFFLLIIGISIVGFLLYSSRPAQTVSSEIHTTEPSDSAVKITTLQALQDNSGLYILLEVSISGSDAVLTSETAFESVKTDNDLLYPTVSYHFVNKEQNPEENGTRLFTVQIPKTQADTETEKLTLSFQNLCLTKDGTKTNIYPGIWNVPVTIGEHEAQKVFYVELNRRFSIESSSIYLKGIELTPLGFVLYTGSVSQNQREILRRLKLSKITWNTSENRAGQRMTASFIEEKLIGTDGYSGILYEFNRQIDPSGIHSLFFGSDETELVLSDK